MSRKHLTARVVRGLGSIRSMVDVELEAGDRGYFGQDEDADEVCDQVQKALDWLDSVVQKYNQDHG